MEWQESLRIEIEQASEALRRQLDRSTLESIRAIHKQYPVQITNHYLSLIDMCDSDDPLYKMVIPSVLEITDDGFEDTSGERQNTIMQGVQHKYAQTLLLLSTNLCATYCRYCFRKRMVGTPGNETDPCLEKVVAYLRAHPTINNVLVTGGDAFLNDTETIEKHLAHLTELEQISYIRFGTRTLATFPQRILQDEALLNVLREYGKKKNIYVITQFNHERELSDQARKASHLLTQSGVGLYNQTVLLNGVNHTPETMVNLMRKLVENGITPYYVFQCRPVKGVKNHFQVPIPQGCDLISAVRSELSGIEKKFRYIMSHETGKIEILGRLDNGNIAFKYHQTQSTALQNKLFCKTIQDDQCWL
jgi:KamA family protein